MKFPISRRFSRRGNIPAAAAYENHAAWRRSAAADNTDQWLLQLVNQHKQRSSQNEHSTNTRTLRGCAVWNKSWRDAKSYITWYRYAGHVVQN